jgi:hypothetical protein
VSLARLVWREGEVRVVYRGQPDEPAEEIDACEFVAGVLAHVPDPKRHVVHYCGAYSNVARGKRQKACASLQARDEAEAPEEMSPEQAARRRSWAELLRRVYEVDPLICPKCGGDPASRGDPEPPRAAETPRERWTSERDRIEIPIVTSSCATT